MQSGSSTNFQTIIQESTLRLRTKNDYGTGFFIAPGLVLTCNHIVKSSVDASEKVKAIWGEQEFSLDVISSFENPDIALLSIDAIDHPCIFLDRQETSVGQLLYGYGYPDNDKDGDCISSVAEGLSDKRRLLTIKDGNVRPGFSGSPLLNIRTEKVCGMIIRRRDRKHPSQAGQQILEPTGGQAIPSEVVMARWAELSSHPSVVKSIFNLKAISQLGLFIESFNQDLTAINPWRAYRYSISIPQSDLKSLLLIWAKKVHFSFSNLEISKVESLLRRLESSTANFQEEDICEYFLVPQTDMRLSILKDFSSLSYRGRAPFDDCFYLFLFLSTNNQSFLNMINAEPIRQRFIEFAEKTVADSISRMYE
jgi:Trypsin-like peptidase domain